MEKQKKDEYRIYYTILITDAHARKIFKELSEIDELPEGLASLGGIIARFLMKRRVEKNETK